MHIDEVLKIIDDNAELESGPRFGRLPRGASEIERIADHEGVSPRRVRARLEKEEMLEALAAEMVERRALDLILESAEYDEVPLDKEEEAAASVATVEAQAVPGALRDPSAPPPEEAPAGEAPATEAAAGEAPPAGSAASDAPR